MEEEKDGCRDRRRDGGTEVLHLKEYGAVGWLNILFNYESFPLPVEFSFRLESPHILFSCLPGVDGFIFAYCDGFMALGMSSMQCFF
jgi:hypothetical protein